MCVHDEALYKSTFTFTLDIGNCRGQSYDSASNMSERHNGVQAIVKRECKYAGFYFMLQSQHLSGC